MLFIINITPVALTDLKKAFQYYNKLSPSLGLRFTKEVERAMLEIAKMPLAYSFRYKNVRGKLLYKFPYLIFFVCNTDKSSIEVLRIFNTYQDSFWLK